MPIATELPIDSTAGALAMANEIFGAGITVHSATYWGDALSSGIYTSGDTISPEATPGDSGVILSTGHVADFTNNNGTTNTNTSAGTSTNTSGINNDADFNALAGTGTRDASFLEMSFTPAGDTITIDFVLSSEEFPEYINSAFNDVVGVWVNGVQATVTVGDGSASIGNINGNTAQNIYNDNTNDQFNTEMDGFTVTLTFVAPVIPGFPNTLKIGVADVGDTSYDTNLRIAGGSVQSTIIAQDDQIVMPTDKSRTLDVLDNDSSTGGTMTVTHINGTAVNAGDTVTLATGQQVTLNANGTFTIVSDSDAKTTYFNYTIEDTAGNTDTALVEVEQVPCFVKGTLIDTPDGAVAIEALTAGMSVMTRDNGPRTIRWIGHRTVAATGDYRPIRLQRGQFGATRDLLLSPQHRVLVTDRWAELLFGEAEVLVKAKDLVNDMHIRPDTTLRHVTYFHILLDHHQIITANGVASESYLPGPATMGGFDSATQDEILALFPHLGALSDGYGPAARLVLKRYEAAPLMAALAA
ncbi:2,3,4,5-tetrahydropyridine-2,6-carboxylate N-succinyltransferase [Sulfitobacter sp. JL08]|uniref:Hint domain-containing protein n=1 Tax=Sulfitobacter sp. JL08 TaxID=2070369 RepID=UPI000E0A12F3|nr:Hint domain-containing protein [Sulfitobacter sp. JL08]AXI54594.1 2,3,4,5-tetrahydropyridine-2,6-carboxylate N-succinyltransferase [Sulfitobacter sp. JL08]